MPSGPGLFVVPAHREQQKANMGAQVAVEVFVDDTRLSPAERAVYLAMAFCADDQTRLSWPSRETLAESTRLSVSTVKRAWKGLQESGLIRPATMEEDPFSGKSTTIVWYLEEVARGVQGDPAEGVTVTQGGFTVNPYKSTTFGSTSPSLRSGEENPSLRSGPRLRLVTEKKTSAKRNLVAYFQVVLNRAVDEYGAEIFGAMDRNAVAGCIRRLRGEGYDDETIAALMDIWATRPAAWNQKIHPSRDFCRKDTTTRLLNAHRGSAEYLAASPACSEVLHEDPDPYAGMSDEEIRAAIEKREREALPTWLRA